MSDNGKLLRKDLAEVKTPFISDSTYEFLRNNVEVVLPAIGTFYFTIASILHLPGGDEVTGIINALVLLLGIVIKANRSRNNKVEAVKAAISEQEEAERKAIQADNRVGDIVVNTGEDNGMATFRFDKEPNEFAGLDEIRLGFIDSGLTPPKE